MNDKRKISVIGGGIGGYTAAIRAARLGAEVTLVERAEMGGTCLNRGCIPFKSLLHSASVATTVSSAQSFGINTAQVEVDFAAVMNRKSQLVAGLRKGIQNLVKAKKIHLVAGTAEMANADQVDATLEHNGESSVQAIPCDRVIIATGSRPSSVSIPGIDEVRAQTSDEFLKTGKLPGNTIIIGGGVIGVELAQILVGLGAQVTILELQDQIIPGFDAEVSKSLERELKRQGVGINTGVCIASASLSGDAKKKIVTFQIDEQERSISADEIVVATGREPVIDGIQIRQLGLNTSKECRGAIEVNQYMETNISHVYAVGDVTGKAMLAHVAAAQAEVAAYNAMSDASVPPKVMDYKAIPSCIYTSPEVAIVGLTEAQAAEKMAIQVGRFPFAASGKAQLVGQTAGMVKIVADKEHGEILGVHIIGSHATDMIAEAVLGINLEITTQELADTIHPHPTLPEGVMEAALTLVGGAIHIP